jgi:predicted Rossmann-fold nucleotide-binding protein
MSEPVKPAVEAVRDSTNAISLTDEDGVRQILQVDRRSVGRRQPTDPPSAVPARTVSGHDLRIRPGQAGTFGYEQTRRLAASLAAMNCDISTGGGPGLMQAANEGAAASPQQVRSVGIRVDLPFEQDVNAFVTEAFEHRTFFTRLHQFVLTSDAFVVAPGGIGTVLETLMIWQLLQVGHLEGTPLILVGKMWPGLIE